MIPFTTCMKFNRKRVNRGGISKQQQQQQQQQHQPPLLLVPPNQPKSAASLDSSSSHPLTDITILSEVHSAPPFLQCPENRLLLTLKRTKTVQRSIHIDPIALLDYSYHGITDRFLENASNWSFNSFTLDTLTGGHSLSSLLFYLFNKYNFITEFKLEIINVWKCFRLFENGYHDTNPYHNSVHAADVTQAMHCFIEEDKIGQHLTPMEKMCSLLAAVAHDLDHPGVNQHFLIATKSHLASLYNNLSVLESHHWRFAMSCLKESGIFGHFDDSQWSMVQFLLRSLILATDVTQQANYLKRFRDSLEKGSIQMNLAEDRLFIMQIALKCADLGNPCRPWVLSKKWTTQICNEFYRQGDYERQLKMSVTPIFDRRTASVARIQTDFFRNIVSPLFQLWDQFLGSKLSRRMMFNLKFNDSQWTNSLEKVNVKRRHSYETVNEKKRKAKDISKSLDDIMSIEEISLDELKEMPKSSGCAPIMPSNITLVEGVGLRGPLLSLSLSASSSPSSGSVKASKGGRRKDSEDSDGQPDNEDTVGTDDNGVAGAGAGAGAACDDDDDEEERIHIGKKQCIGPNGCGTPSPPREKRSSLPIISIHPKLSTTTTSSSSSTSSSPESATKVADCPPSPNCPSTVQQSQSSHQLASSISMTSPTMTLTQTPTNCSSSSSSPSLSPSSTHQHKSSRHHSYHHRHSHSHHHHHHYHHPHHHPHRHSSIQNQPPTQPSLPYIAVSEPLSSSTDCTYTDTDGGTLGDTGGGGGGSGSGSGGRVTGLCDQGSGFSTYSGLPRVVKQLMNYEQSIDKVACLPHSFSALPGYSSTTSPTITPSYQSQSIVDTAQYMRGRRGSAPGCIGIYTGCELAAAALVFLHGTVSEGDDNTLIASSSPVHGSHFHASHSSSSLVHLKCPSSMNPSPTSSSQSSPSSSPPHSSPHRHHQHHQHHHQHHHHHHQQSSSSSSKQRPSLFLTKSNNNNNNSNNEPTGNNNSSNNTDCNKGQKRRSSFPVCDSGHYFGHYLSTEGSATTFTGGKLNSRKSPSSYLHGTAKASSPRLKGRSLELLMSSLTAKTKLLTNQSCSLDSASECRSWLVKREERRGSIPQDILIHSLANYTSANAL